VVVVEAVVTLVVVEELVGIENLAEQRLDLMIDLL
jgi:hypothetical protein